MTEYSYQKYPFLKELELEEQNFGCFSGKWEANGKVIDAISPIDNKPICKVVCGNEKDYERCLQEMEKVKATWQHTPAPRRGEIVRLLHNHDQFFSFSNFFFLSDKLAMLFVKKNNL